MSVGDVVIKKIINGDDESQANTAQVAILNHQRQGGHITCKGRQGCTCHQNDLAHRNFWQQLITVSLGTKQVGSLVEYCLIYITGKTLGLVARSLTLSPTHWRVI